MIKYIISYFFSVIFFYNIILISFNNLEENYRHIICQKNKRNNFLLASGLSVGLIGLYYFADKQYKKILQGKNYHNIFMFLNAHKDRLFKGTVWTKNFIVPVLGYLTIGNYIRQSNDINFKQDAFGKILMQNELIQDNLLACNKCNRLEQDIPNFISDNDILRTILYCFRDGIEIQSILHYIGIEGEVMYYFGLKPYFYYTENSLYYSQIELFEKEIQDNDIEDYKILNLKKKNNDKNNDKKNELKEQLKDKNEKLKKTFENKMMFYFLGTIVSAIVLKYGIQLCEFCKKYIEENGLKSGNILIKFLYQYECYKLVGVICSNVDWIYWSLGVAEYIILPSIFLIIFNKVLDYKKNNKLFYSINKVLSIKNNLLDRGDLNEGAKKEYIEGVNDAICLEDLFNILLQKKPKTK